MQGTSKKDGQAWRDAIEDTPFPFPFSSPMPNPLRTRYSEKLHMSVLITIFPWQEEKLWARWRKN